MIARLKPEMPVISHNLYCTMRYGDVVLSKYKESEKEQVYASISVQPCCYLLRNAQLLSVIMKFNCGKWGMQNAISQSIFVLRWPWLAPDSLLFLPGSTVCWWNALEGRHKDGSLQCAYAWFAHEVPPRDGLSHWEHRGLSYITQGMHLSIGSDAPVPPRK